MTEGCARSVARTAYLWGWPLVNLHNRLPIMAGLPAPWGMYGTRPGLYLLARG